MDSRFLNQKLIKVINYQYFTFSPLLGVAGNVEPFFKLPSLGLEIKLISPKNY